jgi:hypothetical protein
MNHEKPQGDEAKCTMNIGPTGRLKSSHEIATISLAEFDRSHPGEHLYHQPSRRYFVGTELPWISNAATTSIALEDPSFLAAHFQSFLMSKDHLNCKWVWLSSSTNLETAS